MADLRITELPVLPGPAAASADVIPVTDVSASQTKKIQIKDLIEYGVDLIDDGSIPQSKVDLTTINLPDSIVTSLKLADNSSGLVGSGLPGAGDRIGQIAVNTDDNKLYVWGGGAWLEVKAAASVNSVTGDSAGLVLVTVTQTGDVVSLSSELANTSAARQFLAGPTSSGGPVSQRIIVSADLPSATTADKGAVTIGSGLSVSAGGVVSVTNTTAAQTARSLSTWDVHGAVTGGSPIEPIDLPYATIATPGIVQPTGSLTAGPGGLLAIVPGTTAGEFTKVNVNSEGLVTLGALLAPEDIPGINADQVIKGQFTADQIGEDTISAAKLTDYATCLMQEDNPGKGNFLGQLWYTPSTAQLRVYSRGSGPENIWLPVGFGALQANNLRWGGTFNADTDQVGVVTAIGTSEGLVANTPIPAPTDALSGLYLICQVAGDKCLQPAIAGQSFDAGDWALCVDENQGWLKINTVASGGGGGGGAVYLNDLLDVQIGGTATAFSTAPTQTLSNEQIFKYDGVNGMWRNADSLDGGTY